MSYEQPSRRDPEQNHENDLYAERLNDLKELVWNTISAGYSYDELANMLDEDNIDLSVVIKGKDLSKGGEYWKLSISLQNRQGENTPVEFMVMERLLPIQNGGNWLALVSHATDNLTNVLMTEREPKRGMAECTDVPSYEEIESIISDIQTSEVLTPKQGEKVLKGHDKLLRREFPEHANGTKYI